MDQTKATWTTNTFFGAVPPKPIKDALASMNTFIGECNKVIVVIKQVIQTISMFLVAPGDLIATFIKNYSKAIIQVLLDTLSLGGNYIIIHPFNVLGSNNKPKYMIDLLSPLNDTTLNTNNINSFLNKGYKAVATSLLPKPVKPSLVSTDILSSSNFSSANMVDITSRANQIRTTITAGNNNVTSSYNNTKAIYDAKLKSINEKQTNFISPFPSLTPNQAFSEFYASLSDVNDKFKPTWSDNTYAAGLGFIITTGDVSAFQNLLGVLVKFFNFDELTKAKKKIDDTIDKSDSDINQQIKEGWKSVSKIDNSNFSKMWSDITNKNDIIQGKNGETPAQRLTQLSESLGITGKYHWVGLNVYNLPFLSDLVVEINKLVKTITDSITSNNSAIQELTSAIIKKITAFQEVLLSVYEVCSSVVASLENAGLYTFTIPKGLGGINYVKNAIQSSIATSPIANQMDSSQFTMLAFMGASVDVNVDAWSALFNDAYNASMAELDKIFKSGMSTLQSLNSALMTPATLSFKINPDFTQLFKFGDIISLSVDSIYAKQNNETYYFTFKITDNTGTTLSEQNETRISSPAIAKVNSGKFSITLTKPKGISVPSTLSYNYYITIFDATTYSSVYTGTFTVSDSITATNLSSNSTVIKKDSSGRAVSMAILPAGSQLPTSGLDSSTMIITDETGTAVLPIVDYSQYVNHNFDSISTLLATLFLRVPSLPIYVCMNFGTQIQWGLENGRIDTYALPTCIKVIAPGTYTYSILDEGTIYIGKIVITVSSSDTLDIC